MSKSNKKTTTPRQTPPFPISRHDFFLATHQDPDYYCDEWAIDDLRVNDYSPEQEEHDRLRAEEMAAEAAREIDDENFKPTHYIESKISDPPF